MTVRAACAGFLMSVAVVAVVAAQPAQTRDYIGTAEMLADGSLSLRLRAETGAIVGHGTLKVTPGDPRYEEFQRHVGGIAPGEIKPVPPWPDTPDPSRDNVEQRP